MSDIMRPVPFLSLLNWMSEEFRQNRSVFSYPQQKFFRKKNTTHLSLFGENLETPLGPAAGPHTQMTQNIIVAYLAGGRFFELKTVQKLDRLNIPRPCIDAQDEGYNVEWSQELTLEQSFDEYVKAWFILHLLAALQTEKSPAQSGFIFNMSVGYDLAGIKTARMDRFINGLIDARERENFRIYQKQIINWLKLKNTRKTLQSLAGSKSKVDVERLLALMENIPPDISRSVTVSTMHGCPPDEIEAICNYLITEKKLHTYVKLNPTLLGFQAVSKLLKELGYRYIQMDQAAFEHDLQYSQAIPMLKRLKKTAQNQGLTFGVKLSNTLGVKNELQRLPGDEMYLSGRALFPLTISLSYRLAKDFDGQLNISYSGGASQKNVVSILKTGIFPVTMVTELLKPGGYARLQQMAESVDAHPWVQWAQSGHIDVKALEHLTKQAMEDSYYRKERREVESVKVQKSLPLFDCYLAPCREACPIHQDVAEYIRLVEEERYLDAFKVIIETNPLPHITGYICDHQCMYRCTRWDYEDPVYIREMKKVAAEKAWAEFMEQYGTRLKPQKTNGVRVAVIGAGPAGLSAAYFLARAGFEVTVLEKESQAGGVVRQAIPEFRLPEYAIDRDVQLIKAYGVSFRYNVRSVSIRDLSEEGFRYIFVAIGAGKARKLDLYPAKGQTMDALHFLHRYKQKESVKLGKTVAVIGGGNSAMDAARAAKRMPGVQDVLIIYRRTKEFMPADREELQAALQDGVVIKELLLPVSFDNGKLTCQKMKLGEKGSDGRRTVQPLPDTFVELQVDAVISAIGEQVDEQFLRQNNLQIKGHTAHDPVIETNLPHVFIGGDALRGPSTVVQSIADGKKAAEKIIRKEKASMPLSLDISTLFDQKSWHGDIQERKGFIKPLQTQNALHEAARCLACNQLCDKCVEVCPNRANITLAVSNETFFNDTAQILHIDGLCNECGNCATFCPYQGKPYEDKITLFWTNEDFEQSRNNGFLLSAKNGDYLFKVRLKDRTGNVKLSPNGQVLQTDWAETDQEFKGLLLMMREVLNNHTYLLVQSETKNTYVE